jgi:hypothetical protein
MKSPSSSPLQDVSKSRRDLSPIPQDSCRTASGELLALAPKGGLAEGNNLSYDRLLDGIRPARRPFERNFIRYGKLADGKCQSYRGLEVGIASVTPSLLNVLFQLAGTKHS